ncbi:MAG: 3-isopropylmalate dehydratase [Abditibacteriales bacterium]|nr:3-isopropylmalate dehydratase [Abditibacteriales bacterium]MDW8366283.1 3-isopropylmalate dehydratase [Abditibacteriales bacterium]
MKATIRGKAYVVGDNVDTDQIIPARYLVYNPAIPDERKMFGRYALSAVPTAQAGLPQGGVPFVKENADKSEFAVIIGGKNFGCGSSREHAPLALREAGVEVVVAEFYARIFFRNAVNGGYLIPFETDERLCEKIRTGDEVEVNVPAHTLKNLTTGEAFALKPLGDILPIIEAGDVFAYARKSGMIP